MIARGVRIAGLACALAAFGVAPAAGEEYADVSGWSDGQIEEFLSEGTIVSDEPIGSGVTNPHRLVLERDGVRLRAAFSYVDGHVSYTSGESLLMALNVTDRYHYNVAAYRLDRLMGMNMIPPAVIRAVDGEEGSVQLWVEDATTEDKRAKEGIQPPDPAEFDRQWGVMRVFDVLIYNEDRNGGNILYTADWKLRPIDHTRAFRLRSGRPETLRGIDVTVSDEVLPMLEAIDAEALRASTKDLLHPMQVKAVVKRRDQLLKQAAKERK